MNVKDLLKSALLLICLFLTQVSVCQQTSTDPPPPKRPKRTLGTVTNNTGGTGDDTPYCLDDYNKYQITFEVRLANLIHEIGEDGNSYGRIPFHYPKMYFQIEYNGILLEPILLDKFGYYQNSEGIDYYRIFIDSPILDFNDKCPENGNSKFSFKMEGSLLTKTDSVWELYPACDYPDMFPCDLYAGEWCGEDGKTNNDDDVFCQNDKFKSIFRQILMCNCDELKLPDDELPHIGENDGIFDFDDNDGSSIVRSKQEIEFSAYPNPVSHILNIEHGSIKNISIYNAMGMVNYSADINELATSTTIDLNTYPNGVYFMKVESSKDYRIIKVVKK